MPSALFLGESSSLAFLVWKLSTIGWEISFIIEEETSPRRDQQTATSRGRELIYYFGDSKSIVKPRFVFQSIIQCSSQIEGSVFDYVFLSPKISVTFPHYAAFLKTYINAETLILSDSTIFADIDITKSFPDCQCLCLSSDVDCRKLRGEDNSKTYYLFHDEGDKFNYSIGYSRKAYRNFPDRNLQLLINGYQSLKIGTFQRRSVANINTFIFKHLVSSICLECLSIIHEEPDVMVLADSASSALPMMKGLYSELITLVNQYTIYNFTAGTIKIDYDECIQELIYKAAQMSRVRRANIEYTVSAKTVDAFKRFPQFMESSTLFYNFTQKFDLDIIPILQSLLELADTLKCKSPFLESLYSFLGRLVSVRDGVDMEGKVIESKIFSMKNMEEQPQPQVVDRVLPNGIKPEQNMMNYPPFNPLPTETGTTNLGLRIPTNANTNELPVPTKAEEDDLDKLRDLVYGTEELTYGQKADHRAIPAMDEKLKSFAPQSTFNGNNPWSDFATTNTMHNQNPLFSPMGSHTYYLNKSTPQYLPNSNYQLSAPLPLTDMEKGHLYQTPRSGNYYPTYAGLHHAPEFGGIPGSTSRQKKPPTFFRKPIPSTKNTSTKKLYEMHTQLMESVQFNKFIERTTASRYGEFDTTATILHSASNSSKGSKGSTPSRGSSKAELRRHEPNDPKPEDKARKQ